MMNTNPDAGSRHFEFCGECEDICAAAESLLEIYNALRLNDEQINTLRLALDEAVTNAIKHGHKGDCSRIVKIDCEWDPDTIRLSVTDEGPGFKSASLPDPTFRNNLLKESGRGLYIIIAIMSEVHFNEKGNTIHMSLKRRTAE